MGSTMTLVQQAIRECPDPVVFAQGVPRSGGVRARSAPNRWCSVWKCPDSVVFTLAVPRFDPVRSTESVRGTAETTLL